MKCELKLFRNLFGEYLNDIATQPRKMMKYCIFGLVMSIPIVIINETFTPKTDYINVCVIILAIIYLYFISHTQCKP